MNLAAEEFISPYNPNNIKPLRLEDKYGLSNTRRPNLRNSKEIFVRDYYDIDNFTYYLWFCFFSNCSLFKMIVVEYIFNSMILLLLLLILLLLLAYTQIQHMNKIVLPFQKSKWIPLVCYGLIS